ncbi:MAG: hypothetical protein KDK41_09390 [Leptospiraceae bacterium]|nr:hypothetical protein [Leptospiraceae bacterium]
MRLLKITFLSLLISFTFFCGPNPEELSRKSDEALAQEKPELALILAQQAFEAALPSELLPLGRTVYESLLVSADGKKTAAMAKVKSESTKHRFRVWDENFKRLVSFEMDSPPKYAQLSANGAFAAFVYEKPGDENSCIVTALRVEDKEYFAKGVVIPCSCRPAIANRGAVYFWLDGKIYAYDFINETEKIWKKTPDRPYPGITANASFFFSADDIPFFTFGSAGSYKMYNLEEELNMLTKDGAFYRIYFRHDSSEPGILIGGAGQHRVVFFDPSEKRKIRRTVQSGVWQNAAFHDKTLYYYMENHEIYAVTTTFTQDKKGKEKSETEEEMVPIWAREFYASHDGSLTFLSPSGIVIRWPAKYKLSDELKLYYSKAANLDPERESEE